MCITIERPINFETVTKEQLLHYEERAHSAFINKPNYHNLETLFSSF